MKHFQNLSRVRKCKTLTGLSKQTFMNHPIQFTDEDIKMKIVPAFFRFLKVFIKKNNKVQFQRNYSFNCFVAKLPDLKASQNNLNSWNAIQMMHTQLVRICCGRSASSFTYGFVFQVISEETRCMKGCASYLRDMFV